MAFGDKDPFTRENAGFEEPNPLQEILEKIRPHTGQILSGLLVLALVGGGLYLILGDITEVRITVQDAEGTPIERNSVQILSGADNLCDCINQASYAKKLKNGKYAVKALASGYFPLDQELEVSASNPSATLVLEKNEKILLREATFPPTLVVGQLAPVTLRVENLESGTLSAEIVPQGFSGMEFQFAPFEVPGKENVEIQGTVSVQETLAVKDEKAGDKKTGSFRLRYHPAAKNVSFTLLPFPKLTYPSSLSFSGNAGESKKNKVSVRNGSKFAVEGLQLEVEIIQSQANPIEAIPSWFTFPQGQAFSTLAPSGTGDLDLVVSFPVDAKKDTIVGNLVFSSPFLSQPVKKSLTLSVQRETTADVQLSMTSPVSLTFDAAKTAYPKVTREISIYNQGELPIQNITVSVRNPLTCSSDWLAFVDGDQIVVPQLLAKQTEKKLVLVTAPPEARDNTADHMFCQIGVHFIHPVLQKSVEDTITLEIAPR